MRRVWIGLLGLLVSVTGCCGSSGAGRASGIGAEPPARAPIVVTSRCPGFTAGEIEASAIVPIETRVQGIAAVTELRSVSLDGAGEVRLALAPDADRHAVQAAIATKLGEDGWLPAGCEPPALGVGDEAGRQGLVVALRGEEALLGPAADELRHGWTALPGVHEVRVRGVPAERIEVRLDAARAAALGVSAADVAAALGEGSAAAAAGGGVIRVATGFDDVAALGAVALSGAGGSVVVLSDVATIAVERVYDCGRGWLDDRPAAVLTLLCAPDGIPDCDPAPIRAALDDFRATAPAGLEVTVVDDPAMWVELAIEPAFFRDTIDAVTRAAADQGAAGILVERALPRADGLTCDPESTRARVALTWRGEPPAEARPALERALASVPGIAGHVAAPDDAVLALTIAADDVADREQLSSTLLERLFVIPGLLDAWHPAPPSRPDVRVLPDRRHLAEYGLRAADVAVAVRRGTAGETVADVDVDGRRVPVVLHTGGLDADDPARQLDALRSLTVPAGEPPVLIPLSAIATVELALAPTAIHRADLRRVTTVFVRHEPSRERDAREAVAAAIAEIELPPEAWIQLSD